MACAFRLGAARRAHTAAGVRRWAAGAHAHRGLRRRPLRPAHVPGACAVAGASHCRREAARRRGLRPHQPSTPLGVVQAGPPRLGCQGLRPPGGRLRRRQRLLPHRHWGAPAAAAEECAAPRRPVCLRDGGPWRRGPGAAVRGRHPGALRRAGPRQRRQLAARPRPGAPLRRPGPPRQGLRHRGRGELCEQPRPAADGRAPVRVGAAVQRALVHGAGGADHNQSGERGILQGPGAPLHGDDAHEEVPARRRRAPGAACAWPAAAGVKRGRPAPQHHGEAHRCLLRAPDRALRVARRDDL
mmetsp:Transcript_29280/g.91235  ORF Transcript_29280/g.91235 Transcript_29280/m.91235 type:complete len:299 (-) Transcript_29280:607-1503(-)